MKMIQMTENKKKDITCMIEEMLHIGGKLMSCIESMEEDYMYNERHDEHRDYMKKSRYAEYNEPEMEDSMYNERRMRYYR